MLDNKILEQKVNEVFGASKVAQEIVHHTDKAALILIETTEDYALVTLKDFSEQPVGDYDLFVVTRIQKTDNVLKDMVDLVNFLRTDTEEFLDQILDIIQGYTQSLNESSKKISKISILAGYFKQY